MKQSIHTYCHGWTKSFVLLLVAFGILLSSCNKWLDVEPSDRIAGDKLYKTSDGFLSALNGIYTSLNNPSLYGQNLTVGMIDIMGQYYNCAITDHAYQVFMNYNYAGGSYKQVHDEIWSETYKLLTGVNSILEQSESSSSSVLSTKQLDVIKGEALGLRAMLHFDLMRMFSSAWAEETKQQKAIPFKDTGDTSIPEYYTVEEIYDKIIQDLEQASMLLEKSDPVLTEGALHFNNAIDGNAFQYRQYRMNYFAVRALLARIYLYKEDKVNALRVAKELIAKVTDENKPLFPLTTTATWEKEKSTLFGSEVLFALYSDRIRKDVYYRLFAPSLSDKQILTLEGSLSQGRINSIYDDKNDYRYQAWESVVEGGKEVLTLRKFASPDKAAYPAMQPLIRLSEMYLIAAECESNIEVATNDYLNVLQRSRNTVNVTLQTREELETLIQKEYEREFIGEGQLFFFYKRKKLNNIPDGARPASLKNMLPENYVFPIPESEVSQREKE